MKVFKKIFIIIFDIILAAFVLTILLYKLSEIDEINGGSSIPGIGGTSFVGVKSGNQTLEIEQGDMVIAAKVGLDDLKSGDTVVYLSQENKAIFGKIESIKGSNCVLESNTSVTQGENMLPANNIEGICRIKVPYLGYITSFTDTKAGTVLCIAVPIFAALYFIAILLIDAIHNAKRHRKRIIRRKQRRRERYIKEGLYGNTRAMV